MGFENFKLKGAQTVALIRAYFKKTRKKKWLAKQIRFGKPFCWYNRGYCMQLI